ncbi:hypothetical protein GS682_13675 [Nostoc sp. B(2019)]|nr:hypothetical protein [Nostoc sp. B(2019)]
MPQALRDAKQTLTPVTWFAKTPLAKSEQAGKLRSSVRPWRKAEPLPEAAAPTSLCNTGLTALAH